MAEFEDIRIVEMDDKLTEKRDETSAIYEIYLKLSEPPPYEWSELFDNLAKIPNTTIGIGRRAHAEYHHIVLSAPLEELERCIPDLKIIVKNTNERYRQFLVHKAQGEAKEKEAEEAEKKRLSDLKNSLNFDDD